ncbi:MAG: substrate-binding domain-containing protein [Actinobacteria bacterium]|nr:substrate-binding domain-containing protein [Actinomycetota bacterium]
MARAFRAANPSVQVTDAISGTGGGFKRFCAGTTAISNASRRVAADGLKGCAPSGGAREELRVATDGIAVVTRVGVNVGAACLTQTDLRRAWTRGSTAKNWSGISSRFRDASPTLAGPGADSGTHDYLNARVLAVGTAPRADHFASENDDRIVSAVESGAATMGYSGFSYLEKNRTRLSAFKLDAGGPRGCVADLAR